MTRHLVAFDTEEALVAAAQGLRGVEGLDAHTPFHVESLAEVLSLPPSPVRPVMLAAGSAAGLAILALQVWNSVWGYPMNHGGRPLNAWPTFGFTVFETTVLASALAGFVTMVLRMGLPQLHHPFFASVATEAASDDRFYLSVPGGAVDLATLSALPGAVAVIEVAG